MKNCVLNAKTFRQQKNISKIQVQDFQDNSSPNHLGTQTYN